MPSAFAIDTAMTSPRALNEPVGSRPSSLTRISPPPSLLASRGIGTIGVIVSPRLTISSTANREQLAIAPEIGRTRGQGVLAQRSTHASEIVPHQQRLAGARQIVHLIRFMAFAGHRAFKMRDEARPFAARLSSSVMARPLCRELLNTTKCESEKLITKLTPIAATFAAQAGM